MPTRKVTFDMTVVVEVELDEEIDFDKTLRRYANYEDIKDSSWSLERATDNQALLEALLADPDLMERWILEGARVSAQDGVREALQPRREEARFDKEVRPRWVAQLPPASRERAETAIENKLWSEYTDFLFDAVRETLVDANVSIDVAEPTRDR